MDGTFSTPQKVRQRTNTFWHWRLADPHQPLFDHPAGVPLVRYGVCGPKWVDWGECEAVKVKSALGDIAKVNIWEGYTVEEALSRSELFRETFYLSLDACLSKIRRHITNRRASKKPIGPYYFPLS